MKRIFLSVIIATLVAPLSFAESFRTLPASWKWLSSNELAFTYDGTYRDSSAFSFNVHNHAVSQDFVLSESGSGTVRPPKIEGAVNPTLSPDGSRLAFTRGNDLYVADIATGEETRLTFDGSDLILNGFASWVYYEEIFGRSTYYKAFWWSQDGQKLAFYRFDNSDVPLFPIYSAKGQDGRLLNTRYPKAGQTNPSVQIFMADLSAQEPKIVRADFDDSPEQYFGTPFWGPEGDFYVSRMPRSQQELELYKVDSDSGCKELIYQEKSTVWVDWITGMIFTDKGLYMARNIDPEWSQVYFLSYDGKDFRKLSDGKYWRIALERVDGKRGEVFFSAVNESGVRRSLYKTGKKGDVLLTDPSLDVRELSFSPDGRHFAAKVSNSRTPTKVAVFKSSGKADAGYVVADMAGEDFRPEDYALPELVYIQTEDGLSLPGLIVYPKNFDPSKKYPVHVDIYGGPDTPLVNDVWRQPSESNQWWSEQGIIQLTADCRAAGHNGRKGLDMVYKKLTEWELRDFVQWSDWLKSLPYVNGGKIGVEGFSFGGTMTAMLVMRAPESFPYGIAGGGVYDWALYDTHYTERYMGTPENNPDGYSGACVLNYVSDYQVPAGTSPEGAKVFLKLTHGTGDDNVHFQNTLQLVQKLISAGKSFELMIYPDGMHGYRGDQQRHFTEENRRFWHQTLLND